MKTILCVISFLLYMDGRAQIVFEFDHDSASTFNISIGGVNATSQLMIVNFEVSGTQYVNVNRWGKYISIYDLNHSLIKTISLIGFPAQGGMNGVGYILYLSEQLFNTDAKKEFMYVANNGNPNSCYTGIYNEDGVLLFSDTGTASILSSTPVQQLPIYNTINGAKMILSYSNGHAKVFGLAGTLSTAVQEANQNLLQKTGLISNPHPNPTTNATTIDYKIPDGANQGEIVFYDLQGTEVKRFRVDKTFSSLLISTSDIPAGTYYYQLQTSGNTSAGKKMVVVK